MDEFLFYLKVGKCSLTDPKLKTIKEKSGKFDFIKHLLAWQKEPKTYTHIHTRMYIYLINES